MKHITDTRAGAMSERVLTPDERADVEDVLEAAAEWHAGRLPLPAAAAVGTYGDSPAHARFLATTTTPREDARWHDLQAMLTALVKAQGYELTRQGCFSRYDLGSVGAVVHPAERRDAA